ncbi:MAG: hypothetical protein JW891_00375 [Candidatus Lokiarchaeota archaeon]|nr:hypothetical protein [Candidatus Lokiarchaeota archaeon]
MPSGPLKLTIGPSLGAFGFFVLGFVSLGFVSLGFVSLGFVSLGFVSLGFVSSAIFIIKFVEFN